MNAAVQSSNACPATLHEWERVLTNALLRSDAGNADPIRSFEITPETLAGFCGLSIEHSPDAESAFREALLADHYLMWCLQNGTFRTPGSEMPNCMAMLAFSLLVDSLLDGDYEGTGAYRDKMRHWLGVNRTFMNLRGIAIMWEELVAWLDRRVDAGAPFRRLLLPEIPATWTHIGYTRYLSFPTKRDLRFLAKQIERSPKSAADPTALVLLLDPIIRSSSSVSFGLKQAFDDFRAALRSGTASIDHRFWRLMGRARLMVGQRDASLAELRMEFDEDGARRYRLRAVGESAASHPPDIGNAAAAPIVLESPNLGPSIRRGILFFRSSGLASWTASGEPPSGVGPFHLAVAERHARIAAGSAVKFERSGTWHATTEPISPTTISDILRRLGIHNAKESVRSIGLVDGVHVGKAWLGLPRYMPHLDGATGAIEIRAISGDTPRAISWVGDALKADSAFGGEFTISDKSAGWSRRASFVPMADVHVDLDGGSYSLAKLEEWQPGKSGSLVRVDRIEPSWTERDYEYQDVLEALYASSRSGLGEGDAVAIIDRAAGRRSWELLRTLQESTFLDARLRLRWRGRVFTLGRPTLTEVRIGELPGIVASGAVPARLEADFRKTIELQGGLAFRHLDEGSLAPPLLGALQVKAAAVSEALGWAVEGAVIQPDGTAPERLCETKIIGESYQVASAWDWSLGRFRTGAHGAGPVSLVRLVHPGGRDHDLYRVTGGQTRTFTSRHAAIIDAHSQAGRPLFRRTDNLIHRLADEGALPIEVARTLRMRTLRNGGAWADGWRYALAPQDERWLAMLLPDLIEGLRPARSTGSMFSHLRGRGARRPLWLDGGISA